MHTPRSSAPRRGIGAHFVRVASFTAAITALTTIVVADVIAAEPAGSIEALTIDDTDDADAIEISARGDDRRAILAAADVRLADGPLLASAPAPEPEPEPPVEKKKRRKKGPKFGRFEGY